MSNDVLARYDEQELIELSEADTYGGSGLGCAIVSALVSVISEFACPTTACTRSC